MHHVCILGILQHGGPAPLLYSETVSRAFEIEFSVTRVSEDSGQEFARRLLRIPEVERASGHVDSTFTKSHGPEWLEMLIRIRPYVEIAATYIITKLADAVVEAVKTYLKEETMGRQQRRATIYGPNDEVLRIIEIKDGEVTERH